MPAHRGGLNAQREEISRDSRDYSQADIDGIAAELNGRPRQTLGFKTASDALAEALR